MAIPRDRRRGGDSLAEGDVAKAVCLQRQRPLYVDCRKSLFIKGSRHTRDSLGLCSLLCIAVENKTHLLKEQDHVEQVGKEGSFSGVRRIAVVGCQQGM